MAAPDSPPAVAIVGKKNSGKTTLVVALAAELKRRGFRIASLKHGHHGFEIDHPGRDSWRHVHEGGVEAVVVASSDRVALVMRNAAEPDPQELIERFLAGRGYDLVLVEGYKHGPFPKIEIFRQAAHQQPIHDPSAPPAAASLLAVVTDAPIPTSAVPVIRLGTAGPDAAHVAEVADLVQARFLNGRAHGA